MNVALSVKINPNLQMKIVKSNLYSLLQAAIC